MSAQVVMPCLSAGMEQGNLVRWLRHEGDRVRRGDPIAEVETDKTMMEVEATGDGVLARIVVPGGTAEVPVGTVIAVIDDGTGVEHGGDGAPVPPAQDSASPGPRAVQAHNALGLRPAFGPARTSTTERGGRLFISPWARRIARAAGIDATQLRGSGPGGRVIARDVQGGSGSLTAGSYEEVPHDAMRLNVARRLVAAKQLVPHFYLSIDCELDSLLALREQLNGAAPPGDDGRPAYRLSLNDLFIKALASAMARVPAANVAWTETCLHRYRHVDVGVAVALPGGLLTPVVRQADTRTVMEISGEIRELVARARARRLRREEYEGGTTTISNLGMYGVRNFAAIVNPPQATILAIGVGQKRVVVRQDQPVVATVMTCTLSVDHRAVDGAVGAELLEQFRRIVESPTESMGLAPPVGGGETG